MKSQDNKVVKALGKRIVAIRSEKNLTQDDLSAKTDIPRTQIGRIERGEINTTVRTLSRIAKALDVDIKELF